jgi:RNA polymerase sigma factor (sigma-70 family)
MVFAIGVNILKSREDAEDVVQDIFAHKVGPLLEQNPGMGREEMGRYLAVMARNLCIDRYRRRRRFPETELDPEIGIAAGSAEEDGDAKELAPLLESLEPRYKDVLTLKYLLELTWDEVAVRLGLSHAGARKRADLAKRALAAEHGKRNAAESSGPGKGGRR